MHDEAYQWVARWAPAEPGAVLDIGGRNINGTVRDLFRRADPYLSMDLLAGPGVDLVANAANWIPTRQFDVVVCCEVFEHTPAWPAICATSFAALRPGGLFIATMAGPGRPHHSGIDGGRLLHGGEHYANVAPRRLLDVLTGLGFESVTVDQQPRPADVRAVATKPRPESEPA